MRLSALASSQPCGGHTAHSNATDEPIRFRLSEWEVNMKEICEAKQSGYLVEIFGTGEFVFLFLPADFNPT